MPASLTWIRRLALVAIPLSVLLLLVGSIALVGALSPDIGDNELGDAIALIVGALFVVIGVAGVVLGGALAALTKRVLQDPRDIRGSRRTLLIGGLAVGGGEVVVSAVVGGGWFLGVAVLAALATGFLVVAVATGKRGDSVLAGGLAAALLALGVVPILGQAV